jgi:isocitrate dehydrogenase
LTLQALSDVDYLLIRTIRQARFAKVAKELEQNEDKIVEELLAAQGEAVDLGGDYVPDDETAEKVMRPSATLNAIIDAM